ncbi:MAG TPA: sugar ABC transporter permease [Candidatus Udaeobacter sp.]|jgi:multiple sugar transport system permease protein|nr:sugar ABC transporter permease [Candidatus Udaeobacter sp.]
MSGAGERQDRAAWMFLAPALALIGVFFVLPVIAGFLLSFTDFDIYSIGDPRVARLIGAANYRDVLTDAEFWNALRNTLVYVLLGAPLAVLASFGAALLVNAPRLRARGVFRVVFFTPVVTTLVAVAIVWRYLYHPRYGLFDWTLAHFGLPAVDWLGDPHWAMPAIIVLAVWKNFGYNMLIFVAALQAIPAELNEAAELDGAGAWQRFRYVTVPALRPAMLFVTVMTVLANFQLFAEPYVMTQGGPLHSTVSLVMLMYEQGFRWWRMGRAAAIAFLLFVLMLAATRIQLRLQRERAR